MAENNTFLIEIVTPERRVFSGEAELVVLPGLEGEFGVMKGHAAILAALGPGTIKVVCNKTPELYATQGGFAEVLDNKVTLAVETAEHSSTLDRDEIAKEHEEAVNALHDTADPAQRRLADMRVKRISARLSVADKVKPARR